MRTDDSGERIAIVLEDLRTTCKLLAMAISRINVDQYLTKQEVDGFIRDAVQISRIARDVGDRKTSVSQNTQLLFRRVMAVEAGMLNIAKIFLKTRINMLDVVGRAFMSKKQASKYRTGLTPSLIPIFQPKNMDEAIFVGYYGMQCKKCNSWRVSQQSDSNAMENLICMDCNRTFKGFTVSHCSGLGSCGMLFFCEEIKYIKQNKKCPGCEREIEQIPPHIDDYCKE